MIRAIIPAEPITAPTMVLIGVLEDDLPLGGVEVTVTVGMDATPPPLLLVVGMSDEIPLENGLPAVTLVPNGILEDDSPLLGGVEVTVTVGVGTTPPPLLLVMGMGGETILLEIGLTILLEIGLIAV